MNRRGFAQLALGFAATAALTACGGSGGDDSSEVNLREAFTKIEYRMTRDEVRSLVGRTEDGASPSSWSEDGAVLWVFFQSNDAGISVAVALRLDADGETKLRNLAQGE